MKTSATIMIKQNRDALLARGLSALLEQVFYRKPSLSSKALQLLAYIELRQKADDPMSVSEWSNYTREKELTQAQFYDLVAKLKGVSMIRRERGLYKTAGDFSGLLRLMADIWEARSEAFQSSNLSP